MVKQVNFKLETETADLFDKMHQFALEQNPVLTKSVFLELVINAYANPKTQQVDNPEHIARIKKLEQENQIQVTQIAALDEEIINYLDGSKSDVNFLNALRSMLDLTTDADGDAILAEVKSTQNRAFMALQTAPGQIAFTIPELHLQLLTETARLLSEKYATTVTMKDILLDMFIRYTVEQYAEWFYPFVINGDQFTAITGKTQKQLQNLLPKNGKSDE
jgi:hypothetical protein